MFEVAVSRHGIFHGREPFVHVLGIVAYISFIFEIAVALLFFWVRSDQIKHHMYVVTHTCVADAINFVFFRLLCPMMLFFSFHGCEASLHA